MTNTKGSRATQRNVTNSRELLLLADVMTKNYQQSGLDNVAFAAWLNRQADLRAKFRFDVNASHIASALLALDMPSNVARRREAAAMDAGTHLGLLARVQLLEELVAKLQETVRKLKA